MSLHNQENSPTSSRLYNTPPRRPKFSVLSPALVPDSPPSASRSTSGAGPSRHMVEGSDSGYESDGGNNQLKVPFPVANIHQEASPQTPPQIRLRQKSSGRSRHSSQSSLRSSISLSPSQGSSSSRLSHLSRLEHLGYGRTASFAGHDSDKMALPPLARRISLVEQKLEALPSLELLDEPAPRSRTPRPKASPEKTRASHDHESSSHSSGDLEEDPAWNVPRVHVAEQSPVSDKQSLYSNPNGNIEDLKDGHTQSGSSHSVSDSGEGDGTGFNGPTPAGKHDASGSSHRSTSVSARSHNSQPSPSSSPKMSTRSNHELPVRPIVHAQPPQLQVTTSSCPPSPSPTYDSSPLPSSIPLELSPKRAQLNDLFIEATKAMNDSPSSSLLLDVRTTPEKAPLPKVERPTAPPCTPVAWQLNLPLTPPPEVPTPDDSTPRVEKSYLNLPSVTSKPTIQPKLRNEAVQKDMQKDAPQKDVPQDDSFGLGTEFTKWSFLAFGLVGGYIIGSIAMRRGRW